MITGSIVLFNNNRDELISIILSVTQNTFFTKLYLIDNSPFDHLRTLTDLNNNKIEYIHNPTNPGFGAGHNIAIRKAIESDAEFHFVINPDVHIESLVIKELLSYIQSDQNIGMVMPQILNEDGSIQFLPKLLPTPFSILKRILYRRKGWFASFINNYELRFLDSQTPINVPILSGCFTLFRLDALKEIGLYDDDFFMYFEDWDISRRMHAKYKTIYYPKISVFHGYESGANKNRRLFKIFLKSATHYFNKWGWFFDPNRKRINSTVLQGVKKSD